MDGYFHILDENQKLIEKGTLFFCF